MDIEEQIRKTKIVATLGPASSTPEMIRALYEAGANVFRLNFSHGTHEDHKKRLDIIRALEKDVGHPIGVFADLQGPKLRLGAFKDGAIDLQRGMKLRLDLDKTPGDALRVNLPHPEILESLKTGDNILLDDGKVRLKVLECAADFALTEVLAGKRLSDRKGVNLPDSLLKTSPLTEKDRRDLDAALAMGVDWIALSFVQKPEDVAEAKKLIAGRAAVIAKLEKPSAIRHLPELIDMADAVMVARGDLGVELPPEQVPSIQKRIVHTARDKGKTVIVATQMLESMISSPSPTRAEASDVATAIYDGADAVMLSAETASGEYPVEAVTIMRKIALNVEKDAHYRKVIDADHPDPEHTAPDAVTSAASWVARTVEAAAIVNYTTSGSTTLRTARERPPVPILCLTAHLPVARRMMLCYGVYAVHTSDIDNFQDMVGKAVRVSKEQGLARKGQRLVVTAGVPFGTPGSTNVLRVVWVE